jgi:hypothetical protein
MNIVDIREHEGKRVLAVSTGMTSRALAQSKLALSLSENGHAFAPDGTVEPWQFEGTISSGTISAESRDSGAGKDETFIFGKAFEGTPLVVAIAGPRDTAWKALHTAVSAISRAFVEKKISEVELLAIAAAGPGALFVGDDGTVLALPSDLYIRCISSQGEDAEIANRLLWIHPDHRTINPTWAFSFMAGTLAYRIAAGVAPFDRISGTKRNMPKSEALAIDMRSDLFEPVDIAVWAIRPAAAACINALVSTKVATSTDTLVSFGPSIDAVIDPAKEGIPESEEFAAAREEHARRNRMTARRKDFFRRYKTTFRVGAVILVLAGILAGTYINDLRGKPDTKGLTPDKVVQNYYGAIATLDQEIPRAYIKKGVKTGYDEYSSNLYVTSRVRVTYEGAGIVTPAHLFAAGTPGKGMIYGITGFTLSDMKVTGKKAECTVSFWYWLPVSDAATDSSGKKNGAAKQSEQDEILLSVFAYSDRVTLEFLKDRWKISGINELRRELLTDNGAKLVAEIAAGTANSLPYAPSADEIDKEKAALMPTN